MAKFTPRAQTEANDDGLKEKMIAVNRVTKVVKGGRTLSFAALTVVGDGDGRIGMGKGKAKEVPVAVQKAMEVGASQHGQGQPEERLHPPQRARRARRGQGADGAGRSRRYRHHRRRPDARRVRSDGRAPTSFAKSLGSTNPYNMVRATLDALWRSTTPPRWRPSAASRSKTSSTDRRQRRTMATRRRSPSSSSRALPARARRTAPPCAAWACAKLNSTQGAGRHAGGARHDQQGPLPGEGAVMHEINTIKPPTAARRRVAASAVASVPASARPRVVATRARAARATRWLPQGRLRRRPDAAAASPAQARLQVGPAEDNGEVTAEADQQGDSWKPPRIDLKLATLKAAGQAGAELRQESPRSSSRAIILSREGGAQGHRRDRALQGRLGPSIEGVPAARSDLWPRSRRRGGRKRSLIRSDAVRSTLGNVAGAGLVSGNQCVSLGHAERQVRRPAQAGRSSCLLGAWWSIASACTHSGARHRPGRRCSICSRARSGGILNLFNMFSGGALSAIHRVRPGHHALHQRQHHHAADELRGALAGGDQEGRRSRAPQDHAVHALRHGGPGGFPEPLGMCHWRWKAQDRAGAEPRVSASDHDRGGEP